MPWIVRIGDGYCESFCGGVLVRADIVLTAAHCHTEEHKFVILGDHDCQGPDHGETVISVKKFIDHEDYFVQKDGKYALNDISIVVLGKKVPYSDTIRPICLPTKIYHNLSHKRVTASGWGDQKFNDTESLEWTSNLMMIIMEILPNNLCKISKQDYRGGYRGGYNSSTLWCIGDPDYIKGNSKHPKGVWKGDSGGTFLIILDKSYFVLALLPT